MSADWWNGPLGGFDFESTGVDARTCRAVTAGFVTGGPNNPEMRDFLLNPGVEIPAPATAVHGISTEYAREHGMDYAEGIQAIRDLVTELSARMPMVAFNAAYDFTLLDFECRRLGIPAPVLGVILDPLVMDRLIQPRRHGKRTLTRLSEVYGVNLDNAHNASADAKAGVDLARLMLNGTPTSLSPVQFHQTQQLQRKIQQASLQKYLRNALNDPTILCEPEWPIYPLVPSVA